MNVFRVVFIVASTLAIVGTGYVAYHGYGSQSTDLDRSVRQGSGGVYVSSGRVK